MSAAPTPVPRERIVVAALELLTTGGRDAVSTRAVSAAADVQAQTIYRQFGDMRGLLDAVAQRGFDAYLRSKRARRRRRDPVDDLRDGWDLHVEFGLSNPALYRLMYADGTRCRAADQAEAVLRGLVLDVARACRLLVPVDTAVELISAAGIGVVLTLLGTPPDRRNAELSTRACAAVLGAVTSEERSPLAGSGVRERAIALRAALDGADAPLTAGERKLLDELLERLGRLATDQHRVVRADIG